MNNTLSIGSKVRRLAATTDYTNGRTGEIIEINAEAGRYRVLWTHEASGREVINGRGSKGVRTWCKFDSVEALL